jgi:hypothetical protein
VVVEGNFALPDGTKVEIAKDESKDEIRMRIRRIRSREMIVIDISHLHIFDALPSC